MACLVLPLRRRGARSFVSALLLASLLAGVVLTSASARTTTPPDPPETCLPTCTPGGLGWFFRGSLTTGSADRRQRYGDPGDTPLGLGVRYRSHDPFTGEPIEVSYDLSAVYREAVFYVGTSGISYGAPGDIPLSGDWLGQQSGDYLGVYRDGTVYLENRVRATDFAWGTLRDGGAADITFSFGAAGDTPLVGDWNGDGADSIGYQRGNAFVLKNSNTEGDADTMFTFGDAGDVPIVGDWNSDGIDTIGVFRNGAIYLANSNITGVADIAFSYGNRGDVPLGGRWFEWARDTVALVRPLPSG